MDFVNYVKAQWDRVLGWGLIALGGVALLLGYDGVRHSPYVAEQLAYLASGGVGGLWLVGVGSTLLVTANLSDEWRQLDEVKALVARVLDAEGGAVGTEERGHATLAVTSVSLAAISAAIVIAGWIGAERATAARDAFGALGLGAAGLVALGVGSALATIRARARLRAQAGAVFSRFAAVERDRAAAEQPRPALRLLRLPAGRWAHVAGCPMVVGRERDATSVGRAAADDRCPVCAPVPG